MKDDVIAERAPQPLAPAPVQAAAPKSKPVPECPHVLSHWVKGPQGQVKCEVLTKRRALGKGGFAVVYEMHRTEDGRPYACKVVSKESLIKPRARQKLETEVLIHEAVDHPNIVKFFDAWEDEKNVYILMELCSGKTLADVLKAKGRLSEEDTAWYMDRLLGAMRYLHGRKVIHRDLKLSNVFIDFKGDIKIGDFGLACILEYDGQRKTTICGTPNYIAPEVLGGSAVGHSYEVDVWSIGVMIYALVVGKPPFETSDVKSTYKRIKANAYSFPDDCHLSPEARDLIQSILRPEPHLRPTLEELIAHPFLTRFRARPLVTPAPSQPLQVSTPPRAHHHPALQTIPEKGRLLEGAEAPAIPGKPLASPPRRGTASPMTPDLPGAPSYAAHHAAARALQSQSSLRTTPSASSAESLGLTPLSAAAASGSSLHRHPSLPTTPRAAVPGALADAGARVNVGQAAQESLQAKHAARPSTAAYERAAGEDPSSSARPVSAVPATAAAASLARPASALGRPADENADLSHAHEELSRSFAFHLRQQQQQQQAAQAQAHVQAPAPVPREAPSRSVSAPRGRPATAPSDSPVRPEAVPRTCVRSAVEDDAAAASCSVWIHKWIDSEKYGLAFILSDGSVGVLFNDATRIVLEPGRGWFYYIESVRERGAAATDRGAKKEEVQRFPASYQVPVEDRDLNKKVTLLWHFEKHLRKHDPRPATARAAAPAVPSDQPPVYLKKWVRSKTQALIFRLSNKAIQVAFQDATEIVLSSGARAVSYLDKTQVRREYLLTALPNDPELLRRLRYTKEVLYHLINSNTVGKQGGAGTPGSAAR